MELPASDGAQSGRLDDLGWSSLSKQELLVVASIIERAAGFELEHLEMVAEELREQACSGPGALLTLTRRQSAAVASALEQEADRLDRAKERWRESPAIARSGHHAAGFVRSLLERLLKGREPAPAEGLAHLFQLLLVERPDVAGTQQLAEAIVERASLRLQALGLGSSFWPVLEAHAAEAARAALEDGLGEEADPCDFEIVEALEEK